MHTTDFGWSYPPGVTEADISGPMTCVECDRRLDDDGLCPDCDYCGDCRRETDECVCDEDDEERDDDDGDDGNT